MEKAPGKKIKITPNGPYKIEGDIDVNIAGIEPDANGNAVSWIKGRTYARDEEPKHPVPGSFLCRCGHSRHKPFCDGSHVKAGFHGSEQPDKGTYAGRAEAQEGAGVTLLDDSSLCVGARFCDVGDSVWNYAANSADPANRTMAINEACKCPSGRLTVVDADGTAIEPELPPAISAVQDPVNDCRGPLWVQGGIEIEGPNGEQYEVRNRVTLCRCGESHNQPYCDGSHYNCPHMKGADR
ncbi:MAG: CDGSH iron-sulfur domain-containing protein [Planctomycetota bacterium]|nr:CDGSH iron-sulfur domain-containing protein [Planctomycetota bacterium]